MKTRIGPEEKEAVEIDLIGNVGARAKEKLDMVQSILLQNSDDNLERMITKDYNEGFEKFAKLMKSDEAGKYDGSAGLFLLPWKCDSVNEEKIKEECKVSGDKIVRLSVRNCFLRGHGCVLGGRP